MNSKYSMQIPSGIPPAMHSEAFIAEFESSLNKVEKVLKANLDSIPSPSPSVKIQIMGGKVWLRCKDKPLLGVVNKLFVFNVLPYYLK